MTRDSVHTVKISADAGLKSAQDIAALLREAVATHQQIAVDTAAVATADITTIQLLLAARKQAHAAGKSLHLDKAPSGALRELLVQVGLLDAAGQPLTPDGDFWNPPSPQFKGNAA